MGKYITDAESGYKKWCLVLILICLFFVPQAFWIPVQLLNFRFVPIRHQLNVVLCTSIVWTALLSMWYPPVKEEAPVETPKEQ